MRESNHRPSSGPERSAFTLLELLVVIGIVAVLVAIALPGLAAARRAARVAGCLQNERQIGVAIMAYAADFDQNIPYGPPAPPALPNNFYPVTGTVTSLVSLNSGGPVGLGLLLKTYLATNPRVLFCTDPDIDVYADQALANVGVTQVQCDYFYRHGSNYSFFLPASTQYIRLANLGLNRQNHPIKALVMDANFLAAGTAAQLFGIQQRTNHQQRVVNVLFSDGRAETLDDRAGQYTVDRTVSPYNAWDKILADFELAEDLN